MVKQACMHVIAYCIMLNASSVVKNLFKCTEIATIQAQVFKKSTIILCWSLILNQSISSCLLLTGFVYVILSKQLLLGELILTFLVPLM